MFLEHNFNTMQEISSKSRKFREIFLEFDTLQCKRPGKFGEYFEKNHSFVIIFA